jgi:hypothetical protein
MFINRTIVIGAGGTGGWLIPQLARLLAYHDNASAWLTVVDGDKFEDHNQGRQLCGKQQLGQNKAEAMTQLCFSQGLSEVDMVQSYVARPGIVQLLNAQARPTASTLLVLAVDNDATRLAAIEACNLCKGDFFFISPGNSGANDPEAAIKGQVLWYGRLDGVDYGLNPALAFPNIEHPQDAIPREGSCAAQAPSAPQLLSANAMAASLTLAVIQNLLDGALDPAHSSVFFNGRTFKQTIS